MKGEWGEWLDEPTNKHAVDQLDYDSMKPEVRLVPPSLRDLGRRRGSVTGNFAGCFT